MPKDIVSELTPVSLEEAYPARYDLGNWDDPYPTDIIKAAHPVGEAFEIARQKWGEDAGTFTPFESGAFRCNYPENGAPEPKEP